MKITKKQKGIFIPYTIEIEVESKEEETILKGISICNVDIPTVLEDACSVTRKDTIDFQKLLYDNLYEE